LIVARGREVHHLDGAAGQAEGHGPEGGLAGPVGHDVEGCAVSGEVLVWDCTIQSTVEGSLGAGREREREREREPYSAYWTRPLVGSWLASGTSLRSRLARPYPPCGWTALAASLRDEDEKAAAARKGASWVAGLAVQLTDCISFQIKCTRKQSERS
jgi:hypothetical protein